MYACVLMDVIIPIYRLHLNTFVTQLYQYQALATKKKVASTVDRKLVNFHKKGGFMAHLPEGLRKSATNHW